MFLEFDIDVHNIQIEFDLFNLRQNGTKREYKIENQNNRF